jgi:MFS family permease
VLAAFVLFSMVEVVAWVAIIFYAYDEGGVGLAGAIAVLQLLPAAVVAPALASYGDRMPRSRALARSHLGVLAGATATATALVLGAPVAVVVAASGLLTIAISVVRPIHFAALPQLAPGPRELVSANGLSSAAEGLALFVGPIVAGIGAQVAGPSMVVTGTAIAALGAGALCVRLPVLAVPVAAAVGADGVADSDGWRSALAGLSALGSTAGAVVLLVVFTTRFVIAGSLDVLGLAYASEVLAQGETAAGLIIGAVGIGGVVGAMAAAQLAVRPRLTPVVVLGGVVQGVSVALVAVVGVLVPAVGALLLAGVGGAVMMVAGRTLLQRAADDAVLARVFAVQEATSLLGLSLGAAVAPVFADRLGADVAFAVLGLTTLAVAVAGAGSVRALDAQAVLRPEETALLRGVSFLAVLAPYELERLAGRSTWVEAPAGTEVITQGGPGDRYYVVASGELAVTVDGVRRPHVLGPGDGFGEIALLRDVARTATVTAQTNSRLLSVDAADFLGAVTDRGDGRDLAEEIAAAHLRRDEDLGRGAAGAPTT